MWFVDLIEALQELKKIYGNSVVVKKVVDGNIYLSNGTMWHFNAEGVEQREVE